MSIRLKDTIYDLIDKSNSSTTATSATNADRLNYKTIFPFDNTSSTYRKFATINLTSRYTGYRSNLKIFIVQNTGNTGNSCDLYVRMYQQNAMGGVPSYRIETNCDDRCFEIYGLLNYTETTSTLDLYVYGKKGSYYSVGVTLISGDNILSIDNSNISELPSGTIITPTKMGSVDSASKLSTARTISLTGSVTGSGTFDGSANLSIATTTNHTHSYAGSSSVGGAATSANKLNTDKGSSTNPVYFSGGVPVACTYSLNATVPSGAKFTDTTYGANNGVGLSGTTFYNTGVRSIATGTTNGTISVNTNGTAADVSVKGLGTAAYTASSDYAAAGHKHGLLHADFNKQIDNTTTDSGWSMINSTYSGYILKSLRTQANAPSWIENNYAAGICFGGSDTKGVVSCAYNAPYIKFAGGNSTAPVWYIRLTGTSGTSYSLDSMPYAKSAGNADTVDNKHASDFATSGHTHNYAGSSSAGGSATSAVKLDTATAGSATQPVYFTGGKPVACTYTLGKSVPSNAVFTDTNTWRGITDSYSGTATDTSLSQKGANTLYNTLLNGYASTAGSANDAYILRKRGSISGSTNVNANKYIKFARITVNSGAYDQCGGYMFIYCCEANFFHGILGFYLRASNVITSTSITLKWLALTNSKYEDSISAVKVADSVYDLYFQHKDNWSTIEVQYLSTTYAKIEHSLGSFVDSISASRVSSCSVSLSGHTHTKSQITDFSHTHNYAGSSSAGGAATSANKLNTDKGSATQPVYFSGGVPVACTYTLGKSVPSNAVFTDTNTWRGITDSYSGTATDTSLSQKGGNALYNALVNGYASSAGNADTVDNKHASDFAAASHTHNYVPVSGKAFSQYNTGTYVKILEFTISSGSLSPSISFTWHPTECAREIWADFNINIRSNDISFKANWKGGSSRTLTCVGNGTTFSVWVTGTKTSWDPYGCCQVTNTYSINSYSAGTLQVTDTAPSGTYSKTCTTSGYAASAGNADTLDGYHASSFSLTTHTHSYAASSHTHTKSQITDFSHTHNYAGSSSAGGKANDSDKVDGYHIVVGSTGTDANTIYIVT